jgi:hypothetical protein
MSDDEDPDVPKRQNMFSELEGLNNREQMLAIKKMNAGQKKLLAMKGSASIRKMLLRDPNFEIQLAVLNSPKTIESEVESVARLPSSAEIVLKTIFSNPRWMKSYRIKLGLASNPKTPMNIVRRCLRSLTAHDLKKISQNPHLKKQVTLAAKQLLHNKK